MGEPDPPGAPSQIGGIFFLWAPVFWDDHVSHALFFDGPRGDVLVREAMTTPLHHLEADVPGTPLGQETRMATAAHRVRYRTGTRLAERVAIDLMTLDGDVRTIELDPILRFHMKGLGYGHPTWKHGTWHGELAIGGESFDPDHLDLLRPENIHVQQICRASDGAREGVGALEQIVVGPYAPAGFTGALDGAS